MFRSFAYIGVPDFLFNTVTGVTVSPITGETVIDIGCKRSDIPNIDYGGACTGEEYNVSNPHVLTDKLGTKWDAAKAGYVPKVDPTIMAARVPGGKGYQQNMPTQDATYGAGGIHRCVLAGRFDLETKAYSRRAMQSGVLYNPATTDDTIAVDLDEWRDKVRAMLIGMKMPAKIYLTAHGGKDDDSRYFVYAQDIYRLGKKVGWYLVPSTSTSNAKYQLKAGKDVLASIDCDNSGKPKKPSVSLEVKLNCNGKVSTNVGAISLNDDRMAVWRKMDLKYFVDALDLGSPAKNLELSGMTFSCMICYTQHWAPNFAKLLKEIGYRNFAVVGSVKTQSMLSIRGGVPVAASSQKSTTTYSGHRANKYLLICDEKGSITEYSNEDLNKWIKTCQAGYRQRKKAISLAHKQEVLKGSTAQSVTTDFQPDILGEIMFEEVYALGRSVSAVISAKGATKGTTDIQAGLIALGPRKTDLDALSQAIITILKDKQKEMIDLGERMDRTTLKSYEDPGMGKTGELAEFLRARQFFNELVACLLRFFEVHSYLWVPDMQLKKSPIQAYLDNPANKGKGLLHFQRLARSLVDPFGMVYDHDKAVSNLGGMPQEYIKSGYFMVQSQESASMRTFFEEYAQAVNFSIEQYADSFETQGTKGKKRATQLHSFMIDIQSDVNAEAELGDYDPALFMAACDRITQALVGMFGGSGIWSFGAISAKATSLTTHVLQNLYVLDPVKNKTLPATFAQDSLTYTFFKAFNDFVSGQKVKNGTDLLVKDEASFIGDEGKNIRIQLINQLKATKGTTAKAGAVQLSCNEFFDLYVENLVLSIERKHGTEQQYDTTKKRFIARMADFQKNTEAFIKGKRVKGVGWVTKRTGRLAEAICTVYAEATDPKRKTQPTAEQYVEYCDKLSGTLGSMFNNHVLTGWYDGEICKNMDSLSVHVIKGLYRLSPVKRGILPAPFQAKAESKTKTLFELIDKYPAPGSLEEFQKMVSILSDV